ncbi:scavenger receptor class F member 1-like [Haliotis cracherodii]|uniref:scavenger receptor class F member 1-like n=1 Tax=Haliotis cracherodii TaxID=6455 RepID=UPI0039EA89AD
MALAVILVLLSMVVSTQAADCRTGQQCSDCSNTGECKTKCFVGHFGVRCKSNCSNSCLNSVCESTHTGMGRCTEGCDRGYYGIDCRRPCESQDTTCSKCETGCDQGYCASCVSDCSDGYYGPDCKNCSSRCKTCNRITGTCDECYPPYGGNFCVVSCGGNCRPAPNITDTTRCLALGADTSVNCSSECHNQSGECLHGCADGWYGPQCSYPCSAGCRSGRCDAAGACVDGCRPEYPGQICYETCKMCRDGVCDQTSGMCINGCNVSERACGTSCTNNCSKEYCNGEMCKTDNLKTKGVSIGISTASVFLVVCILLSNYICYRKGRSANRENLADVEHSPAEETQSWHKYDDIEEGDLDIEQPTKKQEIVEEELSLAMTAIADVFPAAAAIVHRDYDMSSDSSASSTYESYTHLIPDIVTSDPGKVDRYLSPVEELSLHPPDA